jgi:hypothetical protein
MGFRELIFNIVLRYILFKNLMKKKLREYLGTDL